MNHHDKTKEELIKELQELQEAYDILKASQEKEMMDRVRASKESEANEYNKKVEEALIAANNALKEREKEIQNNYAILNSVFESPENIIIFSLDTNYCYLSFTDYHRQTMKKIWGVDIKIGMNMLGFIHNPDDCEKAKNNFDRVLKGENLRFQEEYGDPSLCRAYYENIYNPIFDSNKNITGLAVFVIDITERKLAEEALKRSEEKFRALHANMSEGSAMHTLVYNDQGIPEDYLIIEVNPAFEFQLGISREEVINKTSRAAYGVDESPYLEIYSRVALTGKPEIFETWYAPLGKYFSISVYCPYNGSFATIFENITERKKAEDEKERTQKLLEDSQRIGKIGGWEMNIDTLELIWTKEMYNIHEVDPTFKPTVGERANFYTPESLAAIDKAVQSAIDQGESYEVDSEIITAKGNHRSVKSIGKVDFENRRVFGFFQDITERKATQEALEQSMVQLELALQSAGAGIWDWDMENGQLNWSKELFLLFGLDPDQDKATFDTWTRIIHPDDREAASTNIEHAIREKIRLSNVYRVIYPDGKVHWIHALGDTTYNQWGKPIRMAGMCTDITGGKKAEQALHETNAYLENLINYANAPIIVWNPQFRITRFNHAFEFITGLKEADVLGKSLEILFPPEFIENSMGLIRKTLTGERWETVEIQIQHCDKSVRTLLWNSATLFRSDDQAPIATIAQGQDITERKRAEDSLKNSAAELRELNATKDKFFSIIAHDLKSPFSSIIGFSDMLKKEARELDINSIVQYAGIINSSAHHTFYLLENLLEWASIQQGKMSFEPKTFLLKNLANAEFDLLKNSADQKNIEMIDDIHKNIIFAADENMIRTVIRNLISNAIKFTPKNGTVKVAARALDDQISISVSDTGIGMTEEAIEKLFKIETSFTSRGTENEKGTGLGLLLCKEFVEKHGGTIRVESDPGKGSRFQFSIPLNHYDGK